LRHSQEQTKHPFNCPLFGTIRVSQYQKGKTSLDFTEAKDSEWQWHQLGHMQSDNHASSPPLSFLQAGCPSCRPTNSVKALKAIRDTAKTETQNRLQTRHASRDSIAESKDIATLTTIKFAHDMQPQRRIRITTAN